MEGQHDNLLHDIIPVYIIMHNMIIVDERDVNALVEDWMEAPSSKVEMTVDENPISRLPCST